MLPECGQLVKVRRSATADCDLLQIFEYGLKEWGFEASFEFARSFDESLDLLAQHPLIGRERSDLREGFRTWLHRGYLIYYEIEEGDVLVNRIIHGSADPTSQLDQSIR